MAGHAPAARPHWEVAPILRIVGLEIGLVDLLDLGRVFGDEAVGLDEIGEHVVARPVAADAPFDVESALLQALESGALAGAALDVTALEPLPPDSPLWKAPNLFITPHTSAVSDRLWLRQADILMQLLERWFDGRDLFNQIDFTRGY